MDNDELQETPDGHPPEPEQDHKGQTAHSTTRESGGEPSSDSPAAMAASHAPALAVTVENEAEEHQSPALMYPVVAFGASAGGLQAFKEVLENLDPETGMSFVLVTHLAPDQKSFLSEIVERYTQMPVHSIEDGLRPKPNHLYVLLPNQTLTLREGMFRIEPRIVDRVPRTIDTFFRSLAADQKNHAIGVVLSGADADGALGLKAIKGEGGIAIVQTPDSAIHSGMPRSSIASDHVDLVIPPAEIARELGRLGAQFARPELRSLQDGGIAPNDEQSYQRILQLLRTISGLDLRQYKPETVRRRIARRLLLLRIEHLAGYLRLLQTRTDELRQLHEDILINVTRFFRDPNFWESLKINVFPVLFQDRQIDKPIRVWCAGCSTGEEVYSLAIAIFEYQSQNSLDIPVQIFGTDASDQSVETARMAVYPDTIASEVTPDRLRRYFLKVDRGYQVSKRVRDTCIFARQNLASDPPFSHIDILSCRNVMIYFNQMLQRQVMLTFHYALDSGGYMLLGMSEGLRDYGDVFNTVDRKHKIYMKTGVSLPLRFEPSRAQVLPPNLGGHRQPVTMDIDSPVWPELELQRAADRIVLARFGPPGLIIDERMNVLQSRGQTSQFMEITPGAVSWSLMRVLRDAVSNEVRKAVQRAIHENIATSETAVLIEESGQQQVQIDVLPITSAATRPRCFLILFQTLEQNGSAQAIELPAQPHLTPDEKDRLVAQLRQDLQSTRFHLQSLVEERDARNQELVSANEEIQSANEELQSTNEELETTKEELQSANEELQTLNDELQQRNNVLTQTGNDLQNLINSVNIPLLMLTSDFHIRQFTPPMQRLLNVRPTDVGRSISEIRLQLSIEDIHPILTEVMESLGTREIEVQDREGRWHLMRVRPYRTADNKIEGLVMVLVDIDQLRRSQQHLLDARNFASNVVESVPVPIVVLNPDCTIRTTNGAFRDLTQMQTKDLENRSLPDLMSLLWGVDGVREKFDNLLSSPSGSSFDFEHQSTTAQKKTLQVQVQVLAADGDRVLLLMIEDITLRREAENLISTQKEALENQVEVASRRLSRTQEELRALTAHLLRAQEEERQHVARDLHDDIGQRLSALEIFLHQARSGKGKEADGELIQSARIQVQSLNNDVRLISHRLHPVILQDLGLPAALRAMTHEFGEREDMPVTFSTHDLPESWSQDTATALYRIAQEALRNVSKHAGKTHVKVMLSGKDHSIELRVMDFGIGFDQESDGVARGLGIISMEERARLTGGKLEVNSSLGHGTTVIAEIPMDGHA